MADVSYAALPSAEQQRLAIDLRSTHRVEDLAEMFGKSLSTISRWTNPTSARKDREGRLARRSNPELRERDNFVARMRRSAVIECEPTFCECTLPASDTRIDHYCRRTSTCVYCGWPEKR